MTTLKRRSSSDSMRHSRFAMISKSAALVVVYLCKASAPSRASAFVTDVPALFSSTRYTPPPSPSFRFMTLEQVSDFYQNFPVQSAVLTCGVKASVADTIAQVKPQIEENNNIKNKQLEEWTLSNASSESPPTTSVFSRHLQGTEQHMIQPSDFSKDTTNNYRIDWEARRNLAYVLYGGIFVGLMSHVEYSYVFPLLFGTVKTAAITTEKVFFDNLIAAPIMWLPPAYFIKAWVYGSESEDSGKGIFKEGMEKYIIDVKENDLLWKYWAIWFPAQSISFSVVPDHLRVAFMASISFFWFILFSTVSSQGDNNVETAISTSTSTSTSD